MEEKTNVMRLLDAKKIKYQKYNYESTGAISGMEVAKALGENPNQVLKTLVTVSKTKKYYVFLVPVNRELNLKKAAQSVGEKSLEMLKQKDLLPLTGYIHGGCSPLGMKKQFPTVIDSSAQAFDSIIFSAGKIGYQVEVDRKNLERCLPISYHEITDE